VKMMPMNAVAIAAGGITSTEQVRSAGLMIVRGDGRWQWKDS